MSTFNRLQIAAILSASILPTLCYAGIESIGPNGINAVGLMTANGQPLTGAVQVIGQVEETRPGKRTPAGPDNFANSNGTIVPDRVWLHGDPFTPPPANMNIDNHAEYVAGIMISTDPTARGVTGGGDPALIASLYSSAFVGNTDAAQQAAESAQSIAAFPLAAVAGINMSFGVTLVESEILDGNAHLAQFVDWSATRHDVLYVVAGNESDLEAFASPTENFNGITVAASAQELDGVYRRVAELNVYGEDVDAVGYRNLHRSTGARRGHSGDRPW